MEWLPSPMDVYKTRSASDVQPNSRNRQEGEKENEKETMDI